MRILEKAVKMLKEYPLCDHCLGRQFAQLGQGLENDERGNVIKTTLTLEAHKLTLSRNKEGTRILRILATNGFSETAKEMLHKMNKRILSKHLPKKCFLCEGKFEVTDELVEEALETLKNYEYTNFLVGIELPVTVEEREDEFKAEFEVDQGENMRNEFGRVIGKKVSDYSRKTVEHREPEVVVLVNPLEEKVKLQINPLYIAGRYRKLVRGIPQSKWFCADCKGKGCEKCNWTGKMYRESVGGIIEKPFLDATRGMTSSFHASGREDIDARMLGEGRPFVIEIIQPKRRFLDLRKLEASVNIYANGKIEVSRLQSADKKSVRKLKKAESTRKEYSVIMEFENEITGKDTHVLEARLTDTMIKQRTPTRVSHRRADLVREKYIYEVKVKKLSPKRAEMIVHCQGGLYIKELVTGDEGRTLPNVSEILENKAKPINLDVLNVILES